MADPVGEILYQINKEVAKLSTATLTNLTEILDAAELELTRDLSNWIQLGKGADRFTPQMYRNALVQIRRTLTHIKGPLRDALESNLKHGGKLAASLATSHLAMQVEAFSAIFEHSVRPIAIEAASVLADGQKILWPRFENSAVRYAGQVGLDIQKQLAIGVVRGETIDQMTTRLAKLGGPKGLVYTRGMAGKPGAKAEWIAEGLFRRYRHFAERLAVTETVNAYNTFALEGTEDLEENDPGYFKRWDAAEDRRTCEICRRYDNLVVGLDATFPGGIKHPPLHPRCRCAVALWRKEWDERPGKFKLDAETPKAKQVKPVKSVPHTVKLPGKPRKPNP